MIIRFTSNSNLTLAISKGEEKMIKRIIAIIGVLLWEEVSGRERPNFLGSRQNQPVDKGRCTDRV
jgi:hypothetical protein